jgi:heme-binding NEAT domain protein
MKKFLGMLLVAVVIFVLLPQQESEAKLKNGTYKVQYTVINSNDNSVSYGNDYFEKPAIVTVKNGKMTAKININHSNWITKFKATTGGNKIVARNKKKNTRTVKFNVKTLSSSKPTPVKVRVEIPSKDYFHNYTIRLKFDKVKKVK